MLLWVLQNKKKFLNHCISTQAHRVQRPLEELPQVEISEGRNIILPRSTRAYDDIKVAFLKACLGKY